ncbi:MAG: hypothetical protein DYG83_18290 [Candidatus Brocadia sp. AMX2]|uniref:Uncharacterized protein n=1 Tax=Candidatus Brocadia sinica JPN1 TaxID=1197129 RepID=A0ABQ0JST4_9BACT|nr:MULTISPECIES: hypothetical protein [Brocadia]MBC6934181.1 hypothetical protein [Candidatus Brocadia sp.]MBL1170768.1 hypothetical protein [Candidatus Brocadia sp. AMX1]NOG43359.1 hypothetical protein [Planctomycetota bacterium]GIK12597.1 MAG: hypothetical protein BroJett002_13040 [Candidatus Brocadia sinica]KAA0241026.1 MAG: hypothetical protein EDM70_18775 [Candidatus Brocadia sp. AMX2]
MNKGLITVASGQRPDDSWNLDNWFSEIWNLATGTCEWPDETVTRGQRPVARCQGNDKGLKRDGKKDEGTRAERRRDEGGKIVRDVSVKRYKIISYTDNNHDSK